MARKYWLDLFVGRTWEEFLKNGAKSSLCTDNVILACSNCHREIHYGKTHLYLTKATTCSFGSQG